MGNLIKNELIKIFRKKSVYIILIVMFLFMILTNCIYRYMYSDVISEEYRLDDTYISEARENIKDIDTNLNSENRNYYINTKTDVDYYDLYKKYDKNSWQAYIIKRDFYNYLYECNVYKYGTPTDKAAFAENPENVLNKKIESLNVSDWKQYVNEEMNVIKNQITELKEEKSQLPKDSSEIKSLDGEIKNLETKLGFYNMRIEKNIPYGNDYLNNALDTIINSIGMDYSYDEPNMSYREKVEKQQDIQQVEKAKYILDNKKDINNNGTARGVLLNMFTEYSLFLIVFVAMILGGMISSELEKGTIKMLLVKPYTRGKILLSKYIVSLLMIVFIFVTAVLMQTVIGGLMFGFDSLSIPVVEYNFNTNSIVTYNVFAYVGLLALCNLPMYILLGTLAFTLSSLFGNSVISIVLPIMGSAAGSIINQLAISRSIKQVAISPTLNWDFTEYLFGRLPSYEFTNFKFAIGVCVAYWGIMMVISYISFKKREIKNI